MFLSSLSICPLPAVSTADNSCIFSGLGVLEFGSTAYGLFGTIAILFTFSIKHLRRPNLYQYNRGKLDLPQYKYCLLELLPLQIPEHIVDFELEHILID